MCCCMCKKSGGDNSHGGAGGAVKKQKQSTKDSGGVRDVVRDQQPLIRPNSNHQPVEMSAATPVASNDYRRDDEKYIQGTPVTPRLNQKKCLAYT